MSLPKYEQYKDSGVEWLGAAPAHWEIRRVGMIFRQVNEEGDEKLSILSVSIHDGVSDRELDEEEMDRKVTRSDDRSKYKKVEPGDLVYNMMRAWQGAFGTVKIQGMVSPAYVVARPLTRFSTSFIEYLLRTPQAIEQMRRLSRGVTDFRLRLYWEEFKSIRIIIPPLAEQTAIAEFLDRETAKIDALVAEQRRLIELLKEKRQAVISHAVTKGLNPDARMKPSGVEWLGDVPEHWSVTRLGFLATKIGSGKTPLGGAEAYTDEGIVFIRSQNVYDEGIYLEDVVYISEITDQEMHCSRIVPGDILLNITGASLGRTCLVPASFGKGNVNQHVCIIRLIESRMQEYVAMVLKSLWMKGQFDAAQNGAAREGLNYSQIAKLALAIPPFAEQLTIIDFLHRETAKLDTLAAEAERAIDLLQERRTALISAAVTGKIDVRGLADADSDH